MPDDDKTRRRAADEADSEENSPNSPSPTVEAGAAAPTPPGAAPSPTPPDAHHLSERSDAAAAAAASTVTMTSEVEEGSDEPPEVLETAEWYKDPVGWKGYSVYVCKQCGYRTVGTPRGPLQMTGIQAVEDHYYKKHHLVQAQSQAYRRGYSGLVKPDGTPL